MFTRRLWITTNRTFYIVFSLLLQSDATDQYCKLVNELVGADQSSEGQSSSGGGDAPPAPGADASKYKEILISQEGGALTITLNRPKKYNAINYQARMQSSVLWEEGEQGEPLYSGQIA